MYLIMLKTEASKCLFLNCIHYFFAPVLWFVLTVKPALSCSLSASLYIWTCAGVFLLQLLGFSPSSQCELVLSAEGSSDLVEDLGLCAVSQAKCLLWLEQWSIVCLWMRSLCLNPALDCRSAQSLLHTAMCKHSKYRWTPLAVYPKSWI